MLSPNIWMNSLTSIVDDGLTLMTPNVYFICSVRTGYGPPKYVAFDQGDQVDRVDNLWASCLVNLEQLQLGL